MVDASHHEFQFKSREASKYSYMRGVGCFPASTSTSYTLAYAASSASETMASTHRAENGAGLMSGAAWFANEVFAGPNEWFQIEFQAPSLIDAITTTGGGAALPFWVSSYIVSHSLDNTGANNVWGGGGGLGSVAADNADEADVVVAWVCSSGGRAARARRR